MGCWNKLRLSLLALLITITCSTPLHSEILYKRYYVHNVNGRDVLSEPYKVRPNDYVIKILKQRGEISQTNFPLFLNIFKLINNHIPNINRIHPGQRIFIPLKWLQPDALPGQKRGIVDLPFITAAPVKQSLADKMIPHKVAPGDSVSRMVSQQFGAAGSPSYQEGMKLFRLVNPEVHDINRIYIGQKLKIPDASIIKESWYESVFQADGEVVLNADIEETPAPAEEGATQYVKEKKEGVKDPFNALTKLLGGVLLNQGRYYFPDTDGKDFSVDLSQTPILQLPEGRRILFAQPNTPLSNSQRRIIATHFKKLRFATTSTGPTLPLLLDTVLLTYPEMRLPMPLSFSEEGLTLSLSARRAYKYDRTRSKTSFRGIVVSELSDPSQRIPLPLAAYFRKYGLVIRESLMGEALPPIFFAPPEKTNQIQITPYTRRVYIQELAKALGLLYDPNVSISFAYAGMQIEATANMLRTPGGAEALVDFGELYGDAVFAIERSGLNVISIGKEDYLSSATLRLLTKMGIPFEKNPRLEIGEPGSSLTCAVTVEGILARPTPLIKKLIIANAIPKEINALLEEKGIGIVLVR